MRRGRGHKLLSANPDVSHFEKIKIKEPRLKITPDKIEQWLNSP